MSVPTHPQPACCPSAPRSTHTLTYACCRAQERRRISPVQLQLVDATGTCTRGARFAKGKGGIRGSVRKPQALFMLGARGLPQSGSSVDCACRPLARFFTVSFRLWRLGGWVGCRQPIAAQPSLVLTCPWSVRVWVARLPGRGPFPSCVLSIRLQMDPVVATFRACNRSVCFSTACVWWWWGGLLGPLVALCVGPSIPLAIPLP